GARCRAAWPALHVPRLVWRTYELSARRGRTGTSPWSGRQDRGRLLSLGLVPETHPPHARLERIPEQGRNENRERRTDAKGFLTDAAAVQRQKRAKRER